MDISAQGTHAKMSVPKCLYWFARCQNVHDPKCPCAEISLCRNLPVQCHNVPASKRLWCQNIPLPKCCCTEMSLFKKSLWWNVHAKMSGSEISLSQFIFVLPGSRFRTLYNDLLISLSFELAFPLRKGWRNSLISSWFSLLFNRSIVDNSWHSSSINSSDLHLKQHTSSQKYFLKRKATRVRHMATQKMRGPCIRLKTMPMYLKGAIWSSDRVNKSHQIAMTMFSKQVKTENNGKILRERYTL